MRTAINAAIIRDHKLLIVKKKQTWILPGGKPEEGETELGALCREVAEELSGTQLQNIRYYNQFEGRTPHTRDILCAKVYFADSEEIHLPSGEITDAQWFDEFSQYPLSDITSKIVTSLREDGYLSSNPECT